MKLRNEDATPGQKMRLGSRVRGRDEVDWVESCPIFALLSSAFKTPIEILLYFFQEEFQITTHSYGW
jgi:hypothetical protein